VTDRLSRVLLSGVLILLVAIFIQPYLNIALFSARSPRPIEARGSLSESERTTIAIFKSVERQIKYLDHRVLHYLAWGCF